MCLSLGVCCHWRSTPMGAFIKMSTNKHTHRQTNGRSQKLTYPPTACRHVIGRSYIKRTHCGIVGFGFHSETNSRIDLLALKTAFAIRDLKFTSMKHDARLGFIPATQLQHLYVLKQKEIKIKAFPFENNWLVNACLNMKIAHSQIDL